MAEENRKTKVGFFKRLKAEFKKIIWTDRNTLIKQTIAVIAISIVICLVISIVDGLALQIIELLMK